MPALVRLLPAAFVVTCAVTACGSTVTRSPTSPAEARSSPVEIITTVDLAKSDPRSHELSGIVWDPRERSAFAITDELPQIIELRPSDDLRNWSLGRMFSVHGVQPWDGEGIALASGRRFIANEQPPRVIEIDAEGNVRSELVLPGYLGGCRRNRCIESLSATPDGRYLFTANEATLTPDGPEANLETGSSIHLLRFDLSDGTMREWQYQTDPVCAAGAAGEVGVSDVAALNDSELLVLERSYIPDVKNCVRVYRTRLSASAEAQRKSLVFDVADLDPTRPFVPNYEGIALGPRLAEGRQVLLLVSDDNARPVQRATLLVLALPARFIDETR